MNKTAIRLAAVAAVAGLGIAGCSSSKKSTGGTSSSAPAAASSSAPAASSAAASSSAPASSAAAGGAQVGVILPDTQSSSRWENQDRPNLQKAFDAAGIKVDIQNALGDKTKFVSIAQGMLQEGVKVLIIVDLDSPSGAQVESAAAQAGVKTIDYDRLTLGGSASYYVSFDNVKVGQLQGQGLVDCLTAANTPKPWKIIELKGSPTDNNATLFAQGYDGVLDPLYANGTAKKLGEQAVPNWDNAQAGTIFENMLTASGGKVDGVIGANDGMGQSVITVEKKHGIKAPVTGQDATVPGLQSILRGDQCGTVFKNTSLEADGASKLAIALIKGTDPGSIVNGSVKDTQANKDVPSVLETPEWVTQKNVEDVVKAGQASASDICAGDVAALCTKYGVS
jgi:D-xylose transport system substrate-binding protein